MHTSALERARCQFGLHAFACCVFVRAWAQNAPSPPCTALLCAACSQILKRLARPLSPSPHPQSAAANGGSRRPRASGEALQTVVDAIKRSPLMLELPTTHPGLSAVAVLVSRPRRPRHFFG
jgi:hypothetical protein